MREYEDEIRSPTGLERLAGLLAATKEDASAEISKLESQVQALGVERETLEAALDSCRDQLGDANSLVEQLRLENTRKWRVEERDDWRALLDSMQADRTALQQRNTRLEAELARCVTALLSAFPPTSPRSGGSVMSKASGARRGHESSVPGDDPDHPPELTHRTAGNRRSNVAVDLGWLASLAQEFNVVPEGVHDNLDGDNDDEASGKGEWPTVDGKEDPGEGRREIESGRASGSNTECAKLRLELDALKHDSDVARMALESQLHAQEQQLKILRTDDAPDRAAPSSIHAPGERGGETKSGVFHWLRRDHHSQKRVTRGGDPPLGGVTVV